MCWNGYDPQRDEDRWDSEGDLEFLGGEDRGDSWKEAYPGEQEWGEYWHMRGMWRADDEDEKRNRRRRKNNDDESDGA